MDTTTDDGRWERKRAILLVGAQGASGEVARIASAASRRLAEAGWAVEAVDLEARRIATCNGCFECWVKTPGVCRIRDYNRELAEKVIGSDLLMLVSRVRFGSYDSEVQTAMEHMIPLISPFFRSVGGETHHARRYEHYPSFGAIGIHCAEDDAARIFRTRMDRIALNFFSPSHSSVVLPGSAEGADLERSVSRFLRALGAVA